MTTRCDAFPVPTKISLARVLAPGTEASFALLRVIAGLLFAFHGVQGLTGFLMPPGIEIEVGSQVWFGKWIELVTGIAIAAGVGTRAAAFLASGTMAVAYVQFHWKLAGGAQFLPAVNQGEPALIYALLFLYVACRGGGRYSLTRASFPKPPLADRNLASRPLSLP